MDIAAPAVAAVVAAAIFAIVMAIIAVIYTVALAGSAETTKSSLIITQRSSHCGIMRPI